MRELNNELFNLLTRTLVNSAQLFDGWHQCEDRADWTEWDTSVRNDISESLRKLCGLPDWT